MSVSQSHGVVAAGDPQTARAGAAMLEQGGTAVDAAVAAAFAAFVCELPLCSPMGGGALIVERMGEEARAFDMFARAPGLGGKRPAALEFQDVEVSFGAATQVFHVGRGSAAVPLALPGLLEAHRRWGKRPLEAIVEPAVALGREGYVLGPGVAYVFEVLRPIIELSAESRALHVDGEEIARAGAALFNRDLAATLERLARRPELLHDLYAELAREFGPESGGLISEADIAQARIVESRPVHVEHRGWTLSTMPGPSTGGALVALGLRLLEGVGRTEFLSREHMLEVAAAQELLLAERDDHFDERIRDPATIRSMLDEAHIASLKKKLDALGFVTPDSPLGSTTHISVIDQHGTAVSLTLTSGEGSGHVLSNTGMVVNNLLGEEDIHPRGFHHDVPGTALATMMAPTLLRRENSHIVLGSGGSNRLRNAILQVLVALLEHGVSPELAVRAPRVQIDADADRRPHLAFEAVGLAPEVVQALRARYPRSPRQFDAPNLYFGGVHLALAEGSSFGGAGDPRRGGAVVVV